MTRAQTERAQAAAAELTRVWLERNGFAGQHRIGVVAFADLGAGCYVASVQIVSSTAEGAPAELKWRLDSAFAPIEDPEVTAS